MATRTDDLELAAAARKGGTTRLLGLIGGGLGLLAVGAGGAYFMFGGQAAPAPAGDHAAAAPGHGESGGHGTASAVYLAFDPPFVVNFEEDGTVRFLQVSVEVLVGSETLAEQVRKHMPVLRDRMILLLSSQTYATLSTREGKEALRTQALDDLRSLLRERLGADTLDGLYFTGFVMQ